MFSGITFNRESFINGNYSDDDKSLTKLAEKGPDIVSEIQRQFNIPRLIALDFFVLTLYDLVLMLDDSSSMKWDEEKRIKDLKKYAGFHARVGTLCDSDGVQVRAMNTDLDDLRHVSGGALQDHITDEASLEQLVSNIEFEGLTPMGTMINDRVITPLVMKKLEAGQFKKPVLLHFLGDGAPNPEPESVTQDNLEKLYRYLDDKKISRGAFSVMFGLVAHDADAVKYLEKLDDDKNIGDCIDVVKDKEMWCADLKKQDKRTEWSDKHWLAKFMLGAIMSKYDSAERKSG